MRIISSQDLFESYMSNLDEAMVEGPRRERVAAKQWDPYATARDRAHAFNIAIRNGLPRQKRSTGGMGARFADYGDRGAGNAARRRQGLPPLRGNTRKEEFELWVNSLVNEGYDLSEYTWEDAYEIYESYSDYLALQAFLIGEGYADSIQESDYMIENMDDDLIDAVLNEVTGDYHYRNWKPLSPRVQSRIKGQASKANQQMNDSKPNSSRQIKSFMRDVNMRAALPGGGGAKPMSRLGAWGSYKDAQKKESNR